LDIRQTSFLIAFIIDYKSKLIKHLLCESVDLFITHFIKPSNPSNWIGLYKKVKKAE